MAASKNYKFVADVKQFAKLTEEAMEKVARDSVQDVMEAAMTTANGVMKGGSIIKGRMPVDTSVLVNSLSSTVVGSGSPSVGAASYIIALSNYKLGDTLLFQWHTKYAMFVEAGTSKFPGWHFVGYNAAQFSDYVEKNVRLHRVE